MVKIIKKANKLSSYESAERWIKKWPLFIYLAVFAIYGNTIFNKYALDDEFVIRNNNQIQQGIKSIPEIFTTPYFQSKETSFGYRPITKFMFAVEYSIFGENPYVSHFINVLLFAFTCVLFLKLLIKIILPKTGFVFVFITLFIWICHPVHTEVVASLKNREEILYLIFCLFSLRFFIRFIEQGKWYFFLTAIVFFVISFLTKQSAIAFALIIPMVLWYMFVKPEAINLIIKNNLKIVISIGGLLIVTYILYKIPVWFFPPEKIALLPFENPLHFNHSIIARLSVTAYAMLINLKLLLIPHPLVFYYGQFTIPDVRITDLLVVFSLLLHGSILFFTVKYLKNKSVLIFGILFYFLGIMPFSNYFMEINGIVAERFLYAPSIGFIIVLTFVLFTITKTATNIVSIKLMKKTLKYTVVLILIVFTVKTIARNSSWKNSLTLYENDIQYLENSVKANDILAQEKMDKVMREATVKKFSNQLKPSLDSIVLLYRRTLSLYPENPKALNNLANIFINFYNKPDIALAYLQKAYSYRKNSFEVVYNLARCYELLKTDTAAARYYSYAISIDPKQYQCWHNLITLYYRNNMPENAKATCELMLKKDTLTEIPYIGLGYYYIMKKDTINAVKNWETAIVRNPQNYDRIKSLSKYFKLHNDPVKAQYYYQKSIQRN